MAERFTVWRIKKATLRLGEVRAVAQHVRVLKQRHDAEEEHDEHQEEEHVDRLRSYNRIIGDGREVVFSIRHPNPNNATYCRHLDTFEAPDPVDATVSTSNTSSSLSGEPSVASLSSAITSDDSRQKRTSDTKPSTVI